MLLIIGGGIAAYKVAGADPPVQGARGGGHPVMTPAAEEFVTPLWLGAMAGGEMFTGLFDRTRRTRWGISSSPRRRPGRGRPGDGGPDGRRRAGRPATWRGRCCWRHTSRCWSRRQ